MGAPNSEINASSANEKLPNDDASSRNSPVISPPLVGDTPSVSHSPPSQYYYDTEPNRVQITLAKVDLALLTFYDYTKIKSDEIRLMLLSPGKDNDQIHCSMKVINIRKIEESPVKYEALSYAWGDEEATEVISLQDIPLRSAKEVTPDASKRSKPRQFHVRPNLFAALKQIRSDSKDVWLWVDAICINQNDDEEKNQQLLKMPDLYNNAWTVTIWIGDCDESNDTSAMAMDFVPSILNLKLLDRMVDTGHKDKKIVQSWVAFGSLLKRAWFSRRWVIQEVAFAKRASIRCGSKILNWNDFSDATNLFMRKIEGIRALYDASKLSKYDPDALNHIESAGAKTMVTLTNCVFRKAQDGSVIDRLWDLEFLVMSFVSFEASDPRDTIYAFMSLAKDVRQDSGSGGSAGNLVNGLVAQYEKDQVDVYIDFVAYIIERSGSLDIICRYWALPVRSEWGRFVRSSSNKSLPSWIGLVENSPFGPPSRFTGRVNGDSFVGEPGHRTYNSSRGMKAVVRFGYSHNSNSNETPDKWPIGSEQETGSERENKRSESCESSDIMTRESLLPELIDETHETASSNTPNTRSVSENSTKPSSLPILESIPRSFNGHLHVKGVVLHRIDVVSSRVVDGTISDDCLRILSPNSGFPDSVREVAWRTLVADRDSDGRNAPLWYGRACAYALRNTSPEGDLNTSKLILNRSTPESVLEFLRRVQTVVWSRKFFSCWNSAGRVGKDISTMCVIEELTGLGSRNIEVGDLVCILFGCSVPVILRQWNKDPPYAVRFICESYVYGKMDGEAFVDMDEKSIEENTVVFDIS